MKAMRLVKLWYPQALSCKTWIMISPAVSAGVFPCFIMQLTGLSEQ